MVANVVGWNSFPLRLLLTLSRGIHNDAPGLSAVRMTSNRWSRGIRMQTQFFAVPVQCVELLAVRGA